MLICSSISRLLCKNIQKNIIPLAGFKHYPPPIKYDHVEFPERPKLKFMEKVPQYPSNIRPPKMQKRLRYMRGPEPLHNTLLHKQYAIVATGGGRMRFGHFEMMRLTLGRKIDVNRMFCIWRVDPPWQPVTKKGQGHRMGGGKGSIDHYVTPIKAGRVIVELGGACEFIEVKAFLSDVAAKLPFKAMAVSQEILDQMKAEKERIEKENINRYTIKYCIQNNMGGCNKWLSPVDHHWFFEHY